MEDEDEVMNFDIKDPETKEGVVVMCILALTVLTIYLILEVVKLYNAYQMGLYVPFWMTLS